MTRATGVSIVPLLCVVLCGAGCQQPPPTARPIAAQELAKRVAGGSAPAIIDVRTPAEYAAGHIPGAINIPQDVLATHLADIPGTKSTEVVVHCQGGKRAAAAEQILVQQGYTNVRDLQGHFGGWVQQGLPVEPPKTP
jgi:rhodanese-related sulfurtransferase